MRVSARSGAATSRPWRPTNKSRAARIFRLMSKSKLTVLIEDSLIEDIKIQAVREKRPVAEITEELWRGYLRKAKGAFNARGADRRRTSTFSEN